MGNIDIHEIPLFFLNICMQMCLHKKAASKLTARVFEDQWEERKLDSYLISTWFHIPKAPIQLYTWIKFQEATQVAM